uniref:Uncharacterized protein n=1 Tax=Pinctada fucata TaxID=50426 RepID=A0A194AJW5_PINFU
MKLQFSDTTTTLYTETRNVSSDHISTAMTPILPKDSTSKYLWFGVTIAIGFIVLCFGCICCKVCLKQSRKPDVSPYGEPSDVLKSITSEYSTPYDARSSTSAIVTVKAEPKPKRTKTRSFKDSFRNSLRKLTNKKVKKKEEKEDSGYSEIGDFSRTRTIDACTTNSKGKVLHKECIIEYSKADNSNPYAVIFLNKE